LTNVGDAVVTEGVNMETVEVDTWNFLDVKVQTANGSIVLSPAMGKEVAISLD